MAKPANPPRPDTLSILYENALDSVNKSESFRGIKDKKAVDKILSKRDVTKMRSVIYGGQPYDISEHQKKYHARRAEREAQKIQKETSGD